jgi:uridine phosphorylase
MREKTLPLTGLPIGGVSPHVLVCGDPQRASNIATYLENAELLAERREYRSFLGYANGRLITVCSHGIGSPGSAIAFEELITAGAKRILRVGTCGSLQPDIRDGHLIVATAAVQNTGYVGEVAPDGYPAVADPHLTIALERSARSTQQAAHTGIVLTRDAFYAAVSAPRSPDYQTMSKANVLAVEMECAALFTLGSLRRVSTAAILAVDGNVLEGMESVDTYNPHRDLVARAVSAAIEAALTALISDLA